MIYVCTSNNGSIILKLYEKNEYVPQFQQFVSFIIDDPT